MLFRLMKTLSPDMQKGSVRDWENREVTSIEKSYGVSRFAALCPLHSGLHFSERGAIRRELESENDK